MKSFFKLREDNEFCCEECVDDSVYGSVEENFKVAGDEQYEDWDLEEGMTGYSTSNVSTQRDPKTYQTRELGKLGYTKRNIKTRSTIGGSGGYSLATRQHSMVSNNTLVKRSPLNQSVDEPNAESIVNEEMHKVSVTVIDPNHTMVSMRKEPIQKTVKVKALDKDNAIYKATQYYKDRGYKVKDHNYVGLAEVKQTWPGHSDTVKNPNFNDELTARRIGPMGRRLKSGKLSADERGQQERTKTLMKFTKLRGGLTGPKGKLPEEFELGEATNDYFARRKREEDIISGKKPARKKAPAQTSDYQNRRDKMKEEVVNELTSDTLQNYKEKAKVSADNLTATGQHKKAADRWLNVMKATGKQIDKTTAGIKTALNKEEVEEIDELSKTTLGAYAKAATRDAVLSRKTATDFEYQGKRAKSPGMKAASDEISQRYKVKSWKRRDGVDKAIDRLTKEENQIDELNKDTLYSYAKKADKDITKKHNELGAQIRADKSAEANKTSMKISNRDKGLDRAQARLNKEGVAEAYGRRDAYTRDYQSSISGMGKRQSAAYHADGGANDEGWGNETSKYKPADHPHSVHINGKKWKTFNSQSHAQNVANKIKGATVHRENG